MSATVSRAAGVGGLMLLFAAGGCAPGDEDRSSQRPVRLEVTAPADNAVVHTDSVEVRGTVRPRGARVLLGGRPVEASAGEFRARVPLRVGSNVVDVGASGRSASASWTAIRVVRQVLVTVPDLAGATGEDAVERLEALGLQPEIEERGGILEALLPRDPRVCDLRPQAGAEVPEGTRVRVSVGKTC
ncbi:MAG TPA: PASTA domain-containing protein [Thermoleophilaceae bacterium]|nr:PASTA domain-containing protein [Thermoleophilaceae bacterium]